MLFYLWILIGVITAGVPLLYYYYMKTLSNSPWTFVLTPSQQLPEISFLIPTFNEEHVIKFKLDNLKLLDYPKNLLNIFIVDSASTDSTIDIVTQFQKDNSDMNIKVITETIREGKSKALNKALLYVDTELFVVSDADCYLPSDVLKKTVFYFSNDEIGAIAGQEKILNSKESWITRNELKYKEKMSVLRVGESKIGSTVIFEGGFSIYRKSSFPGFDDVTGADDSGTAFNIVQSGKKALVVPDLFFYTFFPENVYERMVIKYRRANHLISIWAKAIKLLIRGKLLLSKKITVLMIFLYMVNPILFMILSVLSAYVFIIQPYALVSLVILLIPVTRNYFIEFTQNNVILLLALFGRVLKKDILIWNKIDSTREIVSKSVLMKNGLI